MVTTDRRWRRKVPPKAESRATTKAARLLLQLAMQLALLILRHAYEEWLRNWGWW